jgi:hypothetical protein
MSWPVDWERPASTEPSTKIVRASWTRSFLLVRSASLPQIGVVAVVASSVEVTTQVYADWPPCSSVMIRGSAFETTVEERIATNMPSSRPERASRICRWVMSTAVARVGAVACVIVESLRRRRGKSCFGQPYGLVASSNNRTWRTSYSRADPVRRSR